MAPLPSPMILNVYCQLREYRELTNSQVVAEASKLTGVQASTLWNNTF